MGARYNSDMASSNDYLVYILDLLQEAPLIHYRKMMGEYLLYQDKVLFGGLYDNRFLVKITPSLAEEGLKQMLPYPGAMLMYLIDAEDKTEVARLVMKVVNDLR